jgi:hypothetical protein
MDRCSQHSFKSQQSEENEVFLAEPQQNVPSADDNIVQEEDLQSEVSVNGNILRDEFGRVSWPSSGKGISIQGNQRISLFLNLFIHRKKSSKRSLIRT